MGEWIPAIVAFITALGVVGVAVWNTRGETAALRTLKAMNEALDSLEDSSETRRAFVAARDALARRIAASVVGPPRWRRAVGIALLTAASVLVIGGLLYVTLVPDVPEVAVSVVSAFAAFVGVVVSAAAARSAFTLRTSSEMIVEWSAKHEASDD